MSGVLHVDDDRAREAFVDGILRGKGYTTDRIRRALVDTREQRLDTPPDHLRFGARRIFKGKTVNLGALCDDPADAAWLIDFLDGGTDPVEVEDDDSEGVTVPDEGAEGETTDAEPQPEQEEELADDGPRLREAFAQMPRSLMTKQDGAMLPDWSRILVGIKGQSKRQLEERCLVAEKRFRDSMTRDAVIRQATAGIRGRNATKIRADKHHVIWAAWRWLDRPENQQKIADVIRQAKDTPPEPPARKPVAVKAPTQIDAVGVLLAKVAQRRLRAQTERIKQILGYAGPSITNSALPKSAKGLK